MIRKTRRSAPTPRRARFFLEELEPRLLFSSDVAGVLPPLGPLQNDSGASPLATALLAPAPASEQASAVTTTKGTQAEQTAARELAFVDMGVEGAQDLVDALRADQAAGRAIDIIQIKVGEDGLKVITDTLARYQNVQAVHVFSHGDAQGLNIGTARLDASTLSSYLQDIASWSAAMNADGDLLLYGCNLASSSVGQTLVNDLALLTGADVAASNDLTGASTLGGDWDLEYRQGDVQTIVLSATAWQHTLATVTLQEGASYTVNGATATYAGTVDTYISTSTGIADNTNRAESTTLNAGEDGTGGQARMFLKFDLSMIPAGSTINSVTLYLQITTSNTFTSATFDLHKILTSWSESATWGDINGTFPESPNNVSVSTATDASITSAIPSSSPSSCRRWGAARPRPEAPPSTATTSCSRSSGRSRSSSAAARKSTSGPLSGWIRPTKRRTTASSARPTRERAAPRSPGVNRSRSTPGGTTTTLSGSAS